MQDFITDDDSQSPREDGSFMRRTHLHGDFSTLREPKVHYRDHNSQSLVPVLSQINPIDGLPA